MKKLLNTLIGAVALSAMLPAFAPDSCPSPECGTCAGLGRRPSPGLSGNTRTLTPPLSQRPDSGRGCGAAPADPEADRIARE